MINNKQGAQQSNQKSSEQHQQQYIDNNDEDDMVDHEDVQLKEELDFDGEGEVEDISKDMLQQQVMAVAPAGEDDDELEQQLMQALQNQPEI